MKREKLKSILLNTVRLFWKIRFLEAILVKLTTNKIYGAAVTKLPPNHYQYKKGSLRKFQIKGINYELDISDIMGWYVYFGFKDKARIKLYSLVKKNDVIFDVGANIGETTLNFAKKTGENGKIHSFEPDPINYISVEKNIRINDFNNILLNPFGLGNEEGKFKIYTVDENNRGMNRIVNSTDNISNHREITITRIDDYVKNNNIKTINLIKIDVEGFEFNVLKGALEVLNKFHPILFIELDNQNLKDQGSSANELITYLVENEYEINHAETNEKITPELNFSNCHFDIVAKRKLKVSD